MRSLIRVVSRSGGRRSNLRGTGTSCWWPRVKKCAAVWRTNAINGLGSIAAERRPVSERDLRSPHASRPRRAPAGTARWRRGGTSRSTRTTRAVASSQTRSSAKRIAERVHRAGRGSRSARSHRQRVEAAEPAAAAPPCAGGARARAARRRSSTRRASALEPAPPVAAHRRLRAHLATDSSLDEVRDESPGIAALRRPRRGGAPRRCPPRPRGRRRRACRGPCAARRRGSCARPTRCGRRPRRAARRRAAVAHDRARGVDVAVGDRQHDRLHRRQPERELAGVVLDAGSR